MMFIINSKLVTLKIALNAKKPESAQNALLAFLLLLACVIHVLIRIVINALIIINQNAWLAS